MSEVAVRNKALMRRVYEEMWNNSDLHVAREIFQRPEGVEKFMSQFLQSFPDLQHTIDDMLAEADQIAVRFSADGTHRDEWLGFAPTGKSIHYTGVTWARIADGKIIEHNTCWD